MKSLIRIKLHPGSSQEKIQKISENNYEVTAQRTPEILNLGVWIKEKPIDGKANEALVKILKKEFGLKTKIVSGFKSRDKVLEVLR